MAPALLALFSAAMLGGALLFEHVGGYPPCQLCLYQRQAHLVAGAVAVMALLLLAGRRAGPRGIAILTLSCAALLAAGGGIALFHVGVEQHWWPGLPACGGQIDPDADLATLKAQLLATPVVRCDEVVWSLFGLSMAGYNALFSFIAASAALRTGLVTLRTGSPVAASPGPTPGPGPTTSHD